MLNNFSLIIIQYSTASQTLQCECENRSFSKRSTWTHKPMMEWEQKKMTSQQCQVIFVILILFSFPPISDKWKETTWSLRHRSSCYQNSKETHPGAVSHEGPALQNPHSWFKQKRENRERKHNNVRKTYKIVIPRHTYRAGLVYHYWFELQLFHSQFFFCPTQGSISPSTSHAMRLKTGANKNIGTVKVTQNPLPLRDSKALGEKGATKIRVQKMMSRCRTLLKSYKVCQENTEVTCQPKPKKTYI